jgi:hypothetical protein
MANCDQTLCWHQDFDEKNVTFSQKMRLKGDCWTLILCQNVMFFINFMVNYDQTVPKLYVNIKILMKKHHIFTENEVERQILQSTYGPLFSPYFPSSHSKGLCKNLPFLNTKGV